MEVDNNDNSNEEYEEEEFLVYLDFQSKIKSETLEKPNIKIKMIGFDTDEPIVQVNNKMFRGVFEHAMGTNLFFAENPNPPPMDPNFESIPSTMYKYHSQTDKVLKMERIFITPKQDTEQEDEPTETEGDDEDVVPNESYLEALNHFLKPGEVPPRTLSGSDIINPIEFQTFFRPQMNQDGDEEQSEGINDSMEASDNNERTETETNPSAAGERTEPTEISLSPLKIETIKREKQ